VTEHVMSADCPCGPEVRQHGSRAHVIHRGPGEPTPAASITCADCGARNPYLVADPEGRMVCDHRPACEARQMLRDGATAEHAARHAQAVHADPYPYGHGSAGDSTW
jgi:hypothetical protein